jgi:hypothetical protein
MMTEQTRTGEASHEEPRCRYWRKGDKPCWREAVSKRRGASQGYPDAPLTLCEEHKRALELVEDLDYLRPDLDTLQGFILEEHAKDEGEQAQRLLDILYTQREQLEREYLEGLVKSEAAWEVARMGPDEEPLSFEDAQRAAAQMIRADALTNALTILGELPDESFGPSEATDRFAITAVLESIDRHPDKEAEAIRQRLHDERSFAIQNKA